MKSGKLVQAALCLSLVTGATANASQPFPAWFQVLTYAVTSFTFPFFGPTTAWAVFAAANNDAQDLHQDSIRAFKAQE